MLPSMATLIANPGYIGKTLPPPLVGVNAEATCESRNAVETVLPDVPRIVASYAAGWLDAEGCFSTVRRGLDSFTSRITFGVRDERLQQEFVNWFGGNPFPSRTKEGKPLFCWRIQALKLDVFLKQIYPFLILKKPQAALIFKLREVFKHSGIVDGRRAQHRQEIVDRIKAMNNCGYEPLGKRRPDWTHAEELAYAAGFIDGDGWITIHPRWERIVVIAVANRLKTIPDWFVTVFGGSLKFYAKSKMWQWTLCGEEARQLLTELKPYLLLKPRKRTMIQSEHGGDAVSSLSN